MAAGSMDIQDNILKGVNKYRRQIIYALAYDGVVIRVRFDHEKLPQITLEDENGDDTYLSISKKTMDAFKEKKLLLFDSWMPALFIQVDTYRLKPKVKAQIIKYGKY